jgi:hypothetical protein
MDPLDLLFWLGKRGGWLALVVAGGLGFLAGLFVPPGWWSVSTSILVSYHLFLGWLLLTAKKDVETMRPLLYTLAVHFSCAVVILSFGMGRLFVAHFDAISCCVAIFAYFEREWLFQSTGMTAANGDETVASSAEEYQEWLKYLAKKGPDSSSSECSRKEEFEWWLEARRNRRAANSTESGRQTQ